MSDDSIAGGAGNNDSVTATVAAANPTPETVTVKVTGAVAANTTVAKGTKLNDALAAAGIDMPANFLYRNAGKAFSATAALTDNVELTATAKGSGG